MLTFASMSGENKHYDTPTNPTVPERVPGGCSSGSAVAVASGLADFSLGEFSHGKALYRPVHIGLAANRYADRPLSGGIAKIGHRRSISTVSGRLTEKLIVGDRLKKKKGKEEEEKKKYLAVVLACALPARLRCPLVDREPSPPARCCRPRSLRATIVPLRWERDRGDVTRLFLF
ncbi:hypothetical protein BHE74_00021289 [Ensete ventricosum]|nr:hypothetical protein BHE74_00021289 [Ensete ventricosum]